MVEIEEALHNLHAQERAKREQDQAEAQTERMEQDVPLPSPFARVDAVTPGSPAYQAVRFNTHGSFFSFNQISFLFVVQQYVIHITHISNMIKMNTKEGTAKG